MGILKDLGETVYKNLFAGDKFISSFLDKSGIYKKPDYAEETAKSLNRLVQLKEQEMKNSNKGEGK